MESATIPNMSTRQTMLGLAYLAYTGQSLTSPSLDDLQQMGKTINTTLPNLTPAVDWEVIWGPAVYTTPGSLYQDNMMFVARDKNDSANVAVAIRGTNSISDLDWLLEDLDVIQMMAWPPGSGAGTPGTGQNISESTSIDLQLVLNYMPSVLYNGVVNTDAVSLLTFLQSQTSTAINLSITGHSLGGCLAGTLALYLKQNVSSWDQSGKSVLSCVTFAAPTAGDAGFAALSDGTFKGGPYPAGWDTSLGTAFDAVRCSLDIVPMAWIASNVYSSDSSPIFSTYVPANLNDPQVNFGQMDDADWLVWVGIVDNIFPAVANLITSQNYTQTVADSTQLTGTINPNYAYANKSVQAKHGIEDTFAMFKSQASYQHSGSYPVLLSVSGLTYSDEAGQTQLIANRINQQVNKKPSRASLLPGLVQFVGKTKK